MPFRQNDHRRRARRSVSALNAEPLRRTLVGPDDPFGPSGPFSLLVPESPVRAVARIHTLPHVLSACPKGMGQPTSRGRPVLASFAAPVGLRIFDRDQDTALKSAGSPDGKTWGSRLFYALFGANGSTNRLVGAELVRKRAFLQ